MKIPTRIETHLRQIIGRAAGPETDDATLNGFYQDIAQTPFFPLPGRFRALKLINALDRMPDLQDGVREHLALAVMALWAGYTPSDDKEAVFPDGPLSEAGNQATCNTAPPVNDADSAPAAAHPANPAPEAKTIRLPMDIFTGTKAKRDWFDILLDWVAGCIGLLRK